MPVFLLALGGLAGLGASGDEAPSPAAVEIDAPLTGDAGIRAEPEGDDAGINAPADDESGETDQDPEALEDELPSPATCASAAVTEEDLKYCATTGGWRERLEAGEKLVEALQHLVYPRDADDAAIERGTDLLISMMLEERDDWIASEWLDRLKYFTSPAIDRLFRAALSSASINLRAQAVERLAYEPDTEARDDLDRLWSAAVPAWLRPALIAALARHGIDDHLEEFIAFTEDTDPEVRMAALRALGTLGRPEGAGALLRAAGQGRMDERETAVESLGGLPATPEIVTLLSRFARSDDGGPRGAAIQSLGSLHDTEADSLLLDLLDTNHEPGDLSQVASALVGSRTPGVTAAIAGLLGRISPESGNWNLQEILQTLHNRDDPAALSDLLNLDEPVRRALGDDLDKEIEYLSRDRAVVPASTIVSISCGGAGGVDPLSPRARRIAPVAPFESVRCREAPSLAGDSWRHDRPTAGALVRIDDHFERPGGTWVKLGGGDFSDCWVPLSELVPADTPPSAFDPTRRPHFEFDLPVRDALSAPSRRLIEAGLMQILESDSDDAVVAAALTVDPADPDQVALLDAGSPGRRGVLDRAIARFRHACCGPLP